MDNDKIIRFWDKAAGDDYTVHGVYDKEIKRFLTEPVIMNELESQLASLGKCPKCKKNFDQSTETDDITIWFCKPCYRFYVTENEN